MRILYQYLNCISLDFDRGDLINERNFVAALRTFADVHFAKNQYDFNPKDFDIAFIRANKKMFNYCKGIKRIWMASPYNERIFREADYIATFTEAWSNMLRHGIRAEGINPNGIKWKNVITVYQVLSDHFLTNEAIHPKTNQELKFGCFGSIKGTTYPHLLLESIPTLEKLFTDFKIYLGANETKKSRNKFHINNTKYIKSKSYTHETIPKIISSCDIIIISYSGESCNWDYGGSLKVIETAARGIPMILPKGISKIEMLGNSYPYFLPIEIFKEPITESKIKLFTNTIKTMMRMKVHKTIDRSKRLMEHAKFYSLQQQSKRLEKLFKSL